MIGWKLKHPRFVGSALFKSVLLMVVLGIIGCTGGVKYPPTVKVRGTVNYNGDPLTNGTVTFTPMDQNEGRAAHAEIGEDGTFVVSTFKPGDGIVAGTYAISVTSSLPGTEMLERDRGTGIGGKSAIPARYMDPKTSQFVEEIVAATELLIELEGP